MEDFIFEKDTYNRRALLSYPENWENYLSPEDWQGNPGWVSAPDHAYHLTNQAMTEAAKYQKLPDEPDPYNTISYTEKINRYSGSGFDPKAPYGLWAQHALNNIKIYIHFHCQQEDCLDLRDGIYSRLQNFLFSLAKNKQQSLDFGDLPIGTVSAIMGQMSLYLGNAKHESIQISHAFEFDTM